MPKTYMDSKHYYFRLNEYGIFQDLTDYFEHEWIDEANGWSTTDGEE